MNRRIAVAVAYTLLLVALLLTWPKWTTPPQVDGLTVITGTRSARWLLILTPVLWGWVAYYSEDKWRKRGLIGSLLLLVGCFVFVWIADNMDSSYFCLWNSPGCARGWFR